jgi:hypothetical protein
MSGGLLLGFASFIPYFGKRLTAKLLMRTIVHLSQRTLTQYAIGLPIYPICTEFHKIWAVFSIIEYLPECHGCNDQGNGNDGPCSSAVRGV